jgi:hypothetical protein
MALGFYSGLAAREDRIRTRKELLADKKAASEEWNARFKLQNEEANRTWLERNTITYGQQMSAAERAAALAASIRDDERTYQEGRTAEEREYNEGLAARTRVTDFNFWKQQQDYSAKLSEQTAINAEGRLQAWDQTKFERDRVARKEDLISRVTFENAAERQEFDYRFNKETAASEEAAIAKHASQMQQILVEKVTKGVAIGTDFNAAVGGSSNPMAQIAQYSAGIIALGVKKDNEVLAKLAGLNNPAVMKSVFEKLQKYHTKIIDKGYDDKNSAEIFREGVNSFLNSIIIESPDPSQAEAIIKQMESIEGARPLDDLTKSIIATSTGMGSALVVNDLTLKKTLSISELGQWKEAIAENALNRGRNESSKIKRGVQTANDMSKSDDPDTQALGKELAQWLAGRGLDVNQAIKDATGDNADFLGVTILYGNSSFEEARATQPLLRDAFLPDYLKNPSRSAPIEVPNKRLLEKLASKEFGIIKKGDLVKLKKQDGTFVTFIYGGE